MITIDNENQENQENIDVDVVGAKETYSVIMNKFFFLDKKESKEEKETNLINEVKQAQKRFTTLNFLNKYFGNEEIFSHWINFIKKDKMFYNLCKERFETKESKMTPAGIYGIETGEDAYKSFMSSFALRFNPTLLNEKIGKSIQECEQDMGYAVNAGLLIGERGWIEEYFQNQDVFYDWTKMPIVDIDRFHDIIHAWSTNPQLRITEKVLNGDYDQTETNPPVDGVSDASQNTEEDKINYDPINTLSDFDPNLNFITLDDSEEENKEFPTEEEEDKEFPWVKYLMFSGIAISAGVLILGGYVLYNQLTSADDDVVVIDNELNGSAFTNI